jgi:hypothetical protein
LRFPPEAGKHLRPVEFSLRETAKPIQQGKSLRRTSMYASFLSEFILSLSKDALPQAGFRFAQLASGAFYCAVLFDDFLRVRQNWDVELKRVGEAVGSHQERLQTRSSELTPPFDQGVAES